MWTNYDSNLGRVFSFGEEFKFLNERLRESLLGGPTICFHRHCEINQSGGEHHESVYKCPNGLPYKKIISFDFNGNILNIFSFSYLNT